MPAPISTDDTALREALAGYLDPEGMDAALAAIDRRLESETRKRLSAEAALQDARDALEQRIRERTAKLETANELLRLHIRDRIAAEHSLLESEERYRMLFQNASDAIILALWAPKTLLGAVLDVNATACRWIGLPPERILGAAASDFFVLGPGFELPHANSIEPATHTFEIVFRSANGTHISAEASAYVFDFRGERLVQTIFRDISSRKRAEQNSHQLARELISAQESERQRIARDIHDNIAQELLSLKIGMKMLFGHTTAASRNQRILELTTQLQNTITAVRDLAYDLRPPSLDQLGITSTIYQYCEDFGSRNNLPVEFFSAGMEQVELAPDAGINIYRVIQEGLNNIKKHAQAQQAIIRLAFSHPHILLRIEDNGRGFDVDARWQEGLAAKRMGLQSMKERVALLGGALSVRSKLGKGTRISIQIPYAEVKRGVCETHFDR